MRELRVGIKPVAVVEDERRALRRMRSLNAPIIRGESWRKYFRPATAPANAKNSSHFEDLAAAATEQLGFGSNVGRLAVELQRGNAVDPYDLAAVETKRRAAAAPVELYNGTPDGWRLNEAERLRAAARVAR